MSQYGLVISGLVAEQAQHRRRRDGSSLLVFDVQLPLTLVCRVTKEYGAGEAAAAACSNRAWHLRAGARVTVHASGAERRRGRLDLVGVERIESRDEPAPSWSY